LDVSSKKVAYSLHIERPDPPIELDEWEIAVNTTEGVRLATESQHTAQNPRTGETIGISSAPGDAEIFDTDDNQWHPAIMWSEDRGAGSFNARAMARAMEYDDLSDPGWQVVSNLAKFLEGRIRGDEGEEYDLDTAKPKQS
jgi:hypothetical protein